MTDSWHSEQVQTWMWEKAHSDKLWKWSLGLLVVAGAGLSFAALVSLLIGMAYPTLIAGLLIAPCLVGTANKLAYVAVSLALAVLLALVVPLTPGFIDWLLMLLFLLVVLSKTSSVNEAVASSKGGDAS